MRLANVWCMRIIAIAALALFFGCTTGKTSDSDLSFINPLEAQQLVQGKKKLMGLGGTEAGVWVDPRSEADFRAGHIPGAINMPYERVSQDHNRLKDYQILIVYGSDYNDSRANGMSKRLKELGHSDVRTLMGGLRAWAAAGNTLETGEGGKKP